MSLGFRAEANNNSGVISVAGVDQVVINNAGDVAATTFTGALVGNAATATNLTTTTGVAPVYGVRAWVNFNGFNNTSNVVDAANTNRFIRGSGNVTNVIRNATGVYTMSFATSMPNANYAVIGSSGLEGVSDAICVFSANLTASDVNIYSGQPGRSGINTRIFLDSTNIFVLIIG